MAFTKRIFSAVRRIAGGEVVLLGASVASAVVLGSGVALMAGTEAAKAAFPGANGKIAFQRPLPSERPDVVTGEIFRMNRDGTHQKNLTKSLAYFAASPTYSPNGMKIAFEVDDGDRGLYKMNADGTAIRKISEDLEFDSPAWSPDGKKLAVVGWREAINGGDTEIYKMNSDGTGLKMLTNNLNDYVRAPAWSPDGTKIAFVSNRTGGDEIHTIRADGTGLRRLTNNSVPDSAPDWSPDGKKIAFSRYKRTHHGYINNYEIYTMNSDGTGAKRLTYFRRFDGDPVWSPDGKKIAFSSDRAGRYEFDIYRMNASGGPVTRLTFTEANDLQPTWQPLP